MSKKPTYEELEQRIEDLEKEVFIQAQTNGSLEESEERFRLAFENANIGMCLVDTKGSIVKTNAEMSNIFGYSQEELEGMTVNDIAHPEDLDISPSFIQRASSGEITRTEFEKRYIHNQGHTVWGQVVSSLVQGTKGEPLYFISHVKDITERKRSEEELQESEEKYRAIVEDQTELICRFRPNYRLTFVNEAYARNWGKTPDEMIGVNFLTLIPEHAHENVKKHFSSFSPANAFQIQEHEISGRTGEIRWQQWSNRAFFDDESNIVEFQSVGRDITDRKLAEEALKESERNYRLLINNLPGFVYKGFKDWSVEFYDNSVTMLTGYDMDEFNSGNLKWIDLIVKDDFEPAKQTFIKALKTDKSYVRDYRIETKTGNIIWIQERGYIVCDENGDIEYVSGVFYDITDMKTAEEELKKSRALLHSTIESLPFDFFAINKDDRYILQNSAGKQRWGNIVGKRPDDLKVKKETLDSWLNVNRRAFSGETVKEEIEYFHKGKKEIYHSIVAPIVSEGEIFGILGASIDISDRKIAEAQIRKSEKKYRELWEGLRNGAAAVDMEGRITEFNPAFQKMLGYSTEEIYKLTDEDITPPKWHPIEAKILEEQVFTRGYSDIYEKAYIKKDGTVFPVEVVTYLIQDEAGNPEGMWATIRDITDRKEAERAIKESEQRFRNVYETAPLAFVVWDKKTRVTAWNKKAKEIFGWSKEEIVGHNFFDFLIPGKDRPQVEDVVNSLLKGDLLSHSINENFTKEGKIITCEWNNSALHDHDGNIIGAISLGLDITGRKQAEEELQKLASVVKYSSELINLATLDGKMIFLNEAGSKMLGIDSDKVEQVHIMEVIPDDLKELVQTELLPTLMDGKTWEGELQYRNIKTGELTDVHAMTFTVKDPITQKPLFLANVSIDITERKRTEEEKAKLEIQLQQAQKMEALGTLAGGIAHDFNNLLMGILGRVSLISADVDSFHPHTEHLKEIEEYVKSAADLTKQLLGFARGGRYEVKPTELNELIKNQTQMFGRTQKDINIQEKFEKDLWVVEVDRKQIEQVLLNIYVNAWQAMPEGGSLYIQTKNIMLDEDSIKAYHVEPGKYVRISVTDTGVGMDKATQQRIFDPFFTTKEMSRGTGLGLASAYGIIKNHSGFIDVYSEKGEGTTFNIYLPTSEKEVVKEKKSQEEVLKGTETTLLVDDEGIILDVGQRIIERLGYEVLIAKSGKEAIEIYKKNLDRIDMVILDMVMPEMGGGETFDKLKEINPGIKVLLSSGYSIDGKATEILERGCNGFIQKPFNMVALSKKIREILDKV